MNENELCESAHRIIASLEGADPVVITLPYPIFPIFRFKATRSPKADAMDLVLVKALNDHWPGDLSVQKRNNQIAWKADRDLKPWSKAVDIHFGQQFSKKLLKKIKGVVKDWEDCWRFNPLTNICFIIGAIMSKIGNDHKSFFRLKVVESTRIGDWENDWYIRAHPPILTSPQGSPLILVTAVDLRQAERMVNRGDLDGNRFKKDCVLIFGNPDKMSHFSLVEVGEDRLFRYLLRLNSTKIQPTDWQKENVPLIEEPTSPWMATFIRPLYQGASISRFVSHCYVGGCDKCHKKANDLKLCGRCKAVSYCCVECQRSDWPKHKSACSVKT